MKQSRKTGSHSLSLPLASALLAGGALVGVTLAESPANASSPTTYVSLNGPSGFVASGTENGTKAVRTAQGYDAYYCYYYGYYCCDPDTAEGREACCYYYGTYCNSTSGLSGVGKPEDDYAPAGFAGAGAPRAKPTPFNPLQ